MNQTFPNKLVRMETVKAMTTFSRTKIYELMKLGQFPQCIKIGDRSVAWRESDVQKWVDSKFEQAA